MKKSIATVVASVFLVMVAGAASAATFHLKDVSFSDGSSLTGSFDLSEDGSLPYLTGALTHSSGKVIDMVSGWARDSTTGALQRGEFLSRTPAPVGSIVGAVLSFATPVIPTGGTYFLGASTGYLVCLGAPNGVCFSGSGQAFGSPTPPITLVSGYVTSVAAVPLPAALPLSLAGLAMLAGLARRRRRG